MRMLFISFTGLLKAIRDEKIRPSDLRDGLFYFGCAREHLLEPTVETEAVDIFRHDFHAAFKAHLDIFREFIRAEGERRATSRSARQRPSFEQLNWLLIHNGYPAIPPQDSYAYG